MKPKGIHAAGGVVLSALLVMVLLTSAARAAENELGWTLDSALKQVDRQSKDFNSLLAEVTAVTSDAGGKVTRERAGRMYMNRDGDMRLALGDGSGQVVLVSRVTIWINEASWMPMRQVIEQVSSGEVLTVDYQGAARNLNLNPDLFRSNWPRGTRRLNE